MTKPPGKNGLPADQWDFTQWRFPQLVRPKTQGSQLESGCKTRKKGPSGTTASVPASPAPRTAALPPQAEPTLTLSNATHHRPLPRT